MGSKILSRCFYEKEIMLPGFSENLWAHKDADGEQAQWFSFSFGNFAGRYVPQSIVWNEIVNACTISLATHVHHKP